MKLIGLFDSPFVRRVAISLKLRGMPFEHLAWSVGRDFARIREYNPLGRVPTLVLDDGEVLFESAAILDYVEELAGAGHALLPRSGIERRHALKLMATATGAAEKGVTQIYERVFRPAEKMHQPWVDRCASQVDAALKQLDDECAKRLPDAWLLGNTMTLADITVACATTFLTDALELNLSGFPALQALTLRCEALPVFKETRLAFFVPKS